MLLYHGTYLEIKKPLVAKGRTNVDFGQGFYLTKYKEQAERWAKVIAIRKGKQTMPIVNIYSFDDKQFNEQRFSVKLFNNYDLEWLDYVVHCRRGENICNNIDVIEGGIANDNVIDTVEDYENGRITAQEALGQLQYKKVNHQICIRNQTIIDKYISFVKSYKIE